MRGLFLKGTLLGLILGIVLMLIVFFFTPFGARYVPVSGGGAIIFLVDQWSGDVWRCIGHAKYGGNCEKLAYLP